MPKAWDAHAERDIGLMIARYLLANPAPADSLIASDLEAWAVNLLRDGQARLAELGEPRLCAVPLAIETRRAPRS
jgi:hypothetical protein